MATPELSPVARIAREQDPDRFLCALFAPAERREALFALIAYNIELARARAVASRPMAALIRLQWWRDTVAEAVAAPTRAPPRHEVAGPLVAAIRAGALDPADLTAMADAREAETEDDPFPTFEAFHAYLRGTAGRLAIASGRLLGAPAEALPGLEARGVAYGAAGVLRAAPALARHGRCLLPADMLAAHGLSVETAARDPGASAWSAFARDLLDGRGLAAVPAERLPAAWIAAALPAVLARRDTRRLRRAGLAAAGALQPGRALADRLAVTWAALRGRA